MSDLDELEAAYYEAREVFVADRTDENRDAYKAAKYAFAEARTAQKLAEEADPNHPRGASLVQVSED
jgi:gamma-glutamylcyclotransferase (GGCT)/AIG2-like uncharacterized protein YtfP